MLLGEVSVDVLSRVASAVLAANRHLDRADL